MGADEITGLFKLFGFYALYGLAFVAMVIFAIFAKRGDKKREAALFAFAQSHGLDYLGHQDRRGGFLCALTSTGEDPSDPFLNRFYGFEPFGRGDSQRLENLIVGTKDGLHLYAFDYHFSDGSGKSRRRYHYSVAAARMPISLPRFSLSPENLLSKMGQRLGRHEMKVELDAFNVRYFIKCDEERRVFDLIDPPMIEYLMTLPPRRWQAAGMYVLITQQAALQPSFVYQAFEEIEGFHERIPDMVRNDHGFAPKWSSALD